MARHIMFCKLCQNYTMKESCCDQKAVSSKPPKYSPEDKYAEYRRRVKRPELEKEELL
ncbi:MAG: nucleolar RNA-binding Nop10p family protein [Candidatus Nanoarchaeia archaeon]